MRMTVVAIAIGIMMTALAGAVLAQPADNLGGGTAVTAPGAQLQPTPPGQAATQPSATTTGATQPGKTEETPKLMWIMLAAVAVMWFFMSRNKRKAAAKRQEMVSSLKKGDRVTSIGGIIGSIVEVREDEIVLKIDDNSRLHLARWAIRGVGDEAKKEDDKK